MNIKLNYIKLENNKQKLQKPPFSGKIGNNIFKSISADAWAQWIVFQTKFINENHLDLSEQKNRNRLGIEMKKFLCL
jgi:Fe-S cluster biosynthesis and repair protein YggX